jgi:PAS domain S-box-containing protein
MSPLLSGNDRRFELLVDSLTGYGIYMLDGDGRVASWNRGAQAMKGYSAEEIRGQPFSRFFTLEDRRAGLPDRLMAEALRLGRTDNEGWRVRKDGSQFWAAATLQVLLDDARAVIGFAKITRDMTEQRGAQQALVESERRFRYLVEGVVDYALYMLDPNGVITNWNTGAERIKGYTAAEIVGQHVSRFYTPGDRAAGVPLKGLMTAATEGRFEAEGWRVRKDGTQFWANVVIDAVHDEQGQLVGFAKITRDITDKRNAEAELHRAHEQIAQTQKMEALGQLTGGVAHDFNNLLMVISGHAQLLRAQAGADPRMLRALDAIDVASRRGEDLTRHLLSFARRQRLQTSVAPFAERLTGMRELLSTSLPPTVQLVIDMPDDLWAVNVDQGELDLALLNLAVNARDAMPSGGVLSITAENVMLRHDAASALHGEFVAVTVSDSGVGIPPDILTRVFEPFFTTKEVNKGTGLGLSQVFGFAQQAGGDVRVTSRLGEGAMFVIYLPRSTEACRAPADRPKNPQVPDPPAAITILVVEDHPEVAEVAVALLEQLGHRARVVASVSAALTVLQEAEAPDLVFSDVVMAGDMDGLAFARLLRDEHPGLPVLLATGYSQALERTASEFPILSKPYKLDELNRAIAALLANVKADDGKLVAIDAARRARAARSERGG